MDGNFNSKYSKIKDLKKNKKNLNNPSKYYINVKMQLMAKEIKRNEEKEFIKSLFNNSNVKEKIKIFDIFEENNILYIISDKENILRIERLLEKEYNLEKEGIIFQNTQPITKKVIDELYKYDMSMCKIKYEIIQNDKTLNGIGSGFFCLINDADIPFKKALFTANHILNKNSIEEWKSIIIEHLNQLKTIEMTKNRRSFSDEELDYTCIEILESVKFDSGFFL